MCPFGFSVSSCLVGWLYRNPGTSFFFFPVSLKNGFSNPWEAVKHCILTGSQHLGLVNGDLLCKSSNLFWLWLQPVCPFPLLISPRRLTEHLEAGHPDQPGADHSLASFIQASCKWRLSLKSISRRLKALQCPSLTQLMALQPSVPGSRLAQGVLERQRVLQCLSTELSLIVPLLNTALQVWILCSQRNGGPRDWWILGKLDSVWNLLQDVWRGRPHRCPGVQQTSVSPELLRVTPGRAGAKRPEGNRVAGGKRRALSKLREWVDFWGCQNECLLFPPMLLYY